MTHPEKGAFFMPDGAINTELLQESEVKRVKKRFFDLQLFTGDGEGGSGAAGTGTGTAGNGNGSQNNAVGATYSYEQAEQIAQARADQAEKAALADFFRRQGMSEDEVTAAFADFKAKKAAQQPNVTDVEKERDAALEQVKEMKNTSYLRDKGVKADDLDYVLFKASKQVDDKTDFKKAADAFLKENPRFTGKGYRVVSTSAPDGGSGRSQTVNDSINAAIRSAFGR